MQIGKNKSAAIAIAIFLMFSMGASLMLIPSASAHSPGWTYTTYAYLVANPNPIGVGQQATVYMWLDNVFGTGGASTDYAQITNDYRFLDYQLTEIAPDGTTNSTTFSYISDTTSSQYTYIYPSQVGTYELIFNFPGEYYNATTGNPSSTLIGDYYAPSSATVNLTVTSTPIPAASGSSPLPTAFWMRPIYGENNIWFLISSNWLGTGAAVNSATGSGTLSGFNGASFYQVYPGDAVGSLTGHIMWTDQLDSGGVVGGIATAGILGDTYNEGSAYEQKFTNPIIMDGYLFYKQPIGNLAGGVSAGPEVAQNLVTGQILWSNPTMPAISFGYIYDLQDPNQHGVWAGMLCTSSFGEVFDALTGDWLFNVTNVPSGSNALGPNGNELRYVVANDGTTAAPQWDLRLWNSSLLWNEIGIGSTDILTPALYNYSSTTVFANGAYQAPNGTIATSTGGLVSIPTLNPYLTGAYMNYTDSSGHTNVYTVNGGIDNAASPFDRFDWNVSITWGSGSSAIDPINNMGNSTDTTLSNGTIVKGYTGTGANPDSSQTFTVLATFYNNMMICRNGSYYNGTPQTFAGFSINPYTYFAINLNPNSAHYAVGQVMWWNTIAPESGNVTVTFAGADPTAPDGLGNLGVFMESFQENQEFTGYSMATGQYLWGPTVPQAAFDYYGNPIYPFIASDPAYGMLYSSSFAGIVYAYNETTGNIAWTYGNGGVGNTTNAGFNTPYGDYPTMINAIGNGVLYLVTCEHTTASPIYKGALASAINATDGALIWQASDDCNEFSSMSYAIADGYSVTWNGYDNSIYTFGQGASSTTVCAPNAGLASGQPVVISGTVMDVSPGTQQTEQKLDFPNGVPCSSDASMLGWMNYVYDQQPMPTNFVGVQVTLVALDSNGNYDPIGVATTNTNGYYHVTWTPPVPGNYTVYATFTGTNGYWGSSATTAFTTMNAPVTTTTAPTTTPTSVADMYFVPAIAGLFVLIIIVAIVLALLTIRKRP